MLLQAADDQAAAHQSTDDRCRVTLCAARTNRPPPPRAQPGCTRASPMHPRSPSARPRSTASPWRAATQPLPGRYTTVTRPSLTRPLPGRCPIPCVADRRPSPHKPRPLPTGEDECTFSPRVNHTPRALSSSVSSYLGDPAHLRLSRHPTSAGTPASPRGGGRGLTRSVSRGLCNGCVTVAQRQRGVARSLPDQQTSVTRRPLRDDRY